MDLNTELKVGDKVTYEYTNGDKAKGIVKEIPEHTTTQVRVVYNCNNDWDNYKDYTSQLTNKKSLILGWEIK